MRKSHLLLFFSQLTSSSISNIPPLISCLLARACYFIIMIVKSCSIALSLSLQCFFILFYFIHFPFPSSSTLALPHSTPLHGKLSHSMCVTTAFKWKLLIHIKKYKKREEKFTSTPTEHAVVLFSFYTDCKHQKLHHTHEYVHKIYF